MNIHQQNSGCLDAYVATTGVKVEAVHGGTTKGVTLGVATYYIPLDTNGAPLSAVSLQWSAALAAVITLEVTSFPRTERHQPSAPADVTDWSAVAGEWVQHNPSTAYVPVVGASNSVANLTITAGGAAAGAAVIELGNLGSRRARLKVVVSTGGVLRAGCNGKDALS